MPDPNDKGGANGGAGGGGGDGSPAPASKTVEQRIAELEAQSKKDRDILQATQEELKRVNGLNGVLMQRLNSGGNNPPPDNGNNNGMNANNTVKLRRNFADMDPTADPARFASELVAETAEQVAAHMDRSRAQERQAEELRQSFYTKHKDLVGFEVEVGHFSGIVQAQNPHMTFDQAADEVARRTREYIKSKGLSSANPPSDPPHTLAPGGAGGSGSVPIKPPDAEKPYNADEEYKKDMADYASERAGERERTGTKTGKA